MLGNDQEWVKSLFANYSDVYIVSHNKDPTIDLAIMANHCNVNIMTASASTFAFWGAYLSDNATIYYNEQYIKNKTVGYGVQFTPNDVFLNTWIPLNLDHMLNSTSSNYKVQFPNSINV